MRNYKLTIAYDGTNYHGWQMQINARTIQGELTAVLSLLDHRPVTLHGAGRTDAGVHAEGQVANVLLERPFEPLELREAINAHLDRDLRVMRVVPVDAGFNARFLAKSKTYRYQICTAAVVEPFEFRYVYHHRGELDAGEMEHAAALLLGKHDFGAFTTANRDVENSTRTLTQLDVDKGAGRVVITASADGFLRYMVRTIAGTLIDVGRGRRTPASVVEALGSKRRESAGPTAPARGLTLVRVAY